MNYTFEVLEGQTDTIICSFASAQPAFVKILAPFNHHKVFVCDLTRTWWNYPDTFEDVKTRLNETIEKLQPSRILFVGVSMGGTGAILFSKYCRCDKVVAFSPQMFVEYYYCQRWTSEWNHHVQNLKLMPQHHDVVHHFRSDIPYVLYYGQHNLVDQNHADVVPQQPNIQKINLNTHQHNTASYLRDIGTLTQTIESHLHK